jgi:hypothetical protein
MYVNCDNNEFRIGHAIYVHCKTTTDPTFQGTPDDDEHQWFWAF